MSLKKTYYKNLVLSLSRGTYKGLVSNAKPLYLLTIIRGIEEGLLLGNKLEYSSSLIDLYNDVCNQYEPQRKATLFYKPFFHTTNEPFYFISWRNRIAPPQSVHTPSAKFLREHVEYAALDDELWDLLQDAETREEFKQLIIAHFLQ